MQNCCITLLFIIYTFIIIPWLFQLRNGPNHSNRKNQFVRSPSVCQKIHFHWINLYDSGHHFPSICKKKLKTYNFKSICIVFLFIRILQSRVVINWHQFPKWEFEINLENFIHNFIFNIFAYCSLIITNYLYFYRLPISRDN